MKLSFTTLGCPQWSLDDIFRQGAAFGYHGIELRTNADGNHLKPDADAATLARVKALGQEHGIPVMSVMGYTTFAHAAPETVKANQAVMEQLIRVAVALGAPYVRTFCGKLPAGAEREAIYASVAAALAPCARRAADAGVTIGMETHDDWCAGAALRAVLDRVNSPGLGVVYDIFNAYTAKLEPWDTTYALVKDRICYCHLKDGFEDRAGKHQYCALGGGVMPLAAIMRRFKADGYGSFFSFEWEKKWHPELEAPERAFPQFAYKVAQAWAEA